MMGPALGIEADIVVTNHMGHPTKVLYMPRYPVLLQSSAIWAVRAKFLLA